MLASSAGRARAALCRGRGGVQMSQGRPSRSLAHQCTAKQQPRPYIPPGHIYLLGGSTQMSCSSGRTGPSVGAQCSGVAMSTSVSAWMNRCGTVSLVCIAVVCPCCAIRVTQLKSYLIGLLRGSPDPIAVLCASRGSSGRNVGRGRT